MRFLTKWHLVILMLCVLFGVAGWLFWSNWLESSNFGQIAITLRDGSKVYVIHESWGLNSNQISLRLHPNGCAPPNPSIDYIDTGQNGNMLIYSITNEGLVVYDEFPTPSIQKPVSPWPPGKITIKVAENPTLGMMLANPEKYGVTILRVPLNETCWVNFFRKANSLR